VKLISKAWLFFVIVTLTFVVFLSSSGYALNDLTVNRQWIIDSTADNLAPSTSLLHIKSIVWYPTAADNDLIIMDALGTKTIVRARAICAGTNGEAICIMYWTDADLPDNIKGMDINTIDGGIVHINFKKK